ncbi:MAG TPA: ABC transporter substrate-binding protein, partial [Pseudorhizobium sp.]|nr:ABC transporter substrate-binding protein [Pseudorhizobium sp.]
YALLGAQVLAGARAAAEKSGDAVLVIDENCEAPDANDMVARLVEAQAIAAVGFLCSETLAAALPQLKEAKIPALTLSVRSGILMEDALRKDWPLFRLAPADGDEAEKVSEVILDRWKAYPVALLDDGTIYGRELISAVRQRIEEAGLTPAFVDTYRPGQEQQVALVRRLAKAGVSHAFVGGDRNDVAVIARDAAAENISLQIMAGDTMRAADRPVALRAGTLAVALPPYEILASSAEAVAALGAADVEAEGYTLPAYAAVEIVLQAAEQGTQPLAQAIQSMSFETAIGGIGFAEDHELKENPLRLQEWRDGSFRALDVATD